MRPYHPMTPGERLGWIVAGLGAGLLAGLVLGELFGAVNRRRLAGAVRSFGQDPGRRLRPAEAARTVRAALHEDELLHDQNLSVVATAPGTVELHGWLGSRTLRARAARIVADLPGIDSLINGILVRGEDDLVAHPDLAITDQTA